MKPEFQYVPRFVDIRVKPPKPEEEAAEKDVLSLKPGEKSCEWPECRKAATARAPKSRERPDDFYRFCQPHAAEYNRSWDFFSGMSEGEIRRRQEEELATGGRPTWSMKASPQNREAAAMAAKGGKTRTGTEGAFVDPFDIFGRRPDARPKAGGVEVTSGVGKLERQALADLDLEAGADKATIKARYHDLLKRCHPDHNGGDRGAEIKLQRVIKAYKTLQKAKLA
ncbi:MAG TPA: J domain-containing protein [Caulobacteraceae bacterium]